MSPSISSRKKCASRRRQLHPTNPPAHSPFDTDKGHIVTMASVPSVQCFGKKKTGKLFSWSWEFLQCACGCLMDLRLIALELFSHRCRPLQGMRYHFLFAPGYLSSTHSLLFLAFGYCVRGIRVGVDSSRWLSRWMCGIGLENEVWPIGEENE